jgi:hypothetical protein
VLPWSHLVVSVTSHMRSCRRAQPHLSCLVTAIADAAEQNHARRRGVHLPFRAGRDRPDTRQLTDRITLSDRGVLENARRAAMRDQRNPIPLRVRRAELGDLRAVTAPRGRGCASDRQT